MKRLQLRLREAVYGVGDARVKRMEEYILNMRRVELDGLDEIITAKPTEQREAVAANSKRTARVDACIWTLSYLIPVVTSIVTFRLVLTHGNLTPATAFPSSPSLGSSSTPSGCFRWS